MGSLMCQIGGGLSQWIVNKIAIVHRVFVLSGSIWVGVHSFPHLSLALPTLMQQPLSRNTAFSHVLSSLIFSHMDRSSYPPHYHNDHLSSTF